MNKRYEGKLWIISGDIGAGKTILCGSLVSAFQGFRWKISGVRSPAIMQAGMKVGISVVNLANQENRQLAIHDFKPEGLEDDPIHWTFDPEVLEWGNQVFLDAVPTDLLVIDELGPLEMKKGLGWQNAIVALDSRLYRQAILVMRPKLLELVQTRWQWGKTIYVEHVDQVEDITKKLIQEWKFSEVNK
ncbi:MAG TPA: nucleoside-triphosphatase [Anaerolineaceae bacterium]|nr:nucleoside-triphosphatase [Anaerolineaceae bacterium]